MSSRQVLAAAYKHHGRESLTPAEIVTAISLDRGWFTPEETRSLIENAVEAGDLDEAEGDLSPRFDVGSISIPSSFEPSAELLRQPAPFERILEHLDREGFDRRESVAAINSLQADLDLTSDGAAVMFAHRSGLDVAAEAREVRRSLEEADA